MTRALLLVAMMGVSTPFAFADGYPSRPIRVIVTTSAGGITDVAARVLAQHIAEKTGTLD